MDHLRDMKERGLVEATDIIVESKDTEGGLVRHMEEPKTN